mmetsp:Transcript_14992/g.45253  ORF Transcript_14992/g.45253 Transcript_14992/m.45253 type:complete len:405 (+) Transcript_14992:147-1361(+)
MTVPEQSAPSNDLDVKTESDKKTAADYKTCLRQTLPTLLPEESMASYCKRVGKILDHKDCHVVDAMTQPGLYLYKRPVRGGSGGGGGSMLSAEKLLEQAGSIMHHIVLYVKADDELSALEMGPSGDADVHSNVFEAVEAGPVHQGMATAPPKGPFLHIRAPTHPLAHPAVQQAIEYAQGRQYHTLRGNCIQFADAMVRLLTGGAVFGAPLAYDAAAGTVPPTDSPLLATLRAFMQLSWVDVCDGAGFLADFLAKHEPPPQLASELRLHTTTAQAARASGAQRGAAVGSGGGGVDFAALLGNLAAASGNGGSGQQDPLAGLLAGLGQAAGSRAGPNATASAPAQSGRGSAAAGTFKPGTVAAAPAAVAGTNGSSSGAQAVGGVALPQKRVASSGNVRGLKKGFLN